MGFGCSGAPRRPQSFNKGSGAESGKEEEEEEVEEKARKRKWKRKQGSEYDCRPVATFNS